MELDLFGFDALKLLRQLESESNVPIADSQLINAIQKEKMKSLLRLKDVYHRTLCGRRGQGTENDEDVDVDDSEEVSSSSAAMYRPVETPSNWLTFFALTRRATYIAHATALNRTTANHSFYKLMHWCNEQNIFIHPAIRFHRERSEFRDFKLVLTESIPKHCPLIAVPEHMCIGYQLPTSPNDLPKSDLHDEARDKQFAEATGTSDSDIVQFFFESLGMIVTDLLTALKNPVTDKRSIFAESLQKIRSMMNAPYLDDDVVFGKDDTCIADVLLQMIRNYIAGGPLVNRVERDLLKWAVSVSLSHSTPLAIGSNKSIGIIPVIHLLPHGGQECNCVVIARNSRRNAGARMAAYFHHKFGLDFAQATSGPRDDEPKWVYLVPMRDLAAGEEIQTQAMAPVCDKEAEAAHMWKLSCGQAPTNSMPTAKLSSIQTELAKEIVHAGGVFLESKIGVSK